MVGVVVPELGEVVSIYEGVGSHIYEIKNCVRSEDLETDD